jgi:hypothetical protein
LSAAAVVVTGALTSAPSALNVPSAQVLPAAIEWPAGTQSTPARAKEPDSQWFILSEERQRMPESAQTLPAVPAAPTQRWVF